jgi:opacity protein-like surface antigen
VGRRSRAPQATDGRSEILGLFGSGGKPGLALAVSDSVSLGLRYQYLRQEDLRLEVAKTGALDEGYSSHKLVLRARWQF